MERLTKKDNRGKYYTVSQKLGISDKQINPITSWIEDCEERNFGNPINKLGRLEDLEEEIGCPLDVRCKVIMGTSIYDGASNEYNVDLIYKNRITCTIKTNSEDIDEIYQNLYSFQWRCYGKTWWLRKDKSE